MKTRNVNGVEIPVFRYVADNGNFLTYALFYEYRATHIVDFQSQIFNLKEDDYKGTYSLKKIYLSFNDPTEYSFAIAVFGNWKYWKRLQSSSFLQLHLEEWREEMEIKLRSKGIDIQVGIAGDDLHKSQAAASKWLADKGWELKTYNKNKLGSILYYKIREAHPTFQSSLVQSARDQASGILKREKFKQAVGKV